MWRLLLTSLLAGVPTSDGPSPAPALPPSIRATLDAGYPAWTVAAMNEETAETWRRTYPGRPANVLRGDYDGDGHVDYALMIEFAAVEDGHPVRQRRAIAFLRRGSRYRAFALTGAVRVHPQDGLHVWPMEKGMVYDLNVDRQVRIEHEGIQVLLEGSGPCTTFFYRRGRFDSLWTCD